MRPQDGLTREEQLDLMRSLLSDSWDLSDGHEAPLHVDILYRQILTEAFGKLKNELRLPRLKILYTFLCTMERVSTSVAAGLLSDSSDMVERADQVVRDFMQFSTSRMARFFGIMLHFQTSFLLGLAHSSPCHVQGLVRLLICLVIQPPIMLFSPTLAFVL
jgi:hypothetical protein